MKDGDFLIPCQTPVHPFDLEAGQQAITVLDKQMARLVVEWDRSWVTKQGFGVRPSEAEAMKLVFEHNKKTLVPEVLFSSFPPDQDLEPSPSEVSKPDYQHPQGLIGMTIISGVPLEQKWDTLDDNAKESVCRELWDLISELRTIPRPPEIEGLYQCLADGSPSQDPMLEDLQSPARPLSNDEELRARIYERYLNCGGTRYENELPDMLPRSECSVFTHADIAPRNVMVDEQNCITGILDWEWAGWYPDYWEYAQILRPAFWGDWSVWMEKTAPQRWDLTGINASRKVLF